MTTPTAPMTKLDAVNLMLASIGQSPLNTISGTIPKDAAKAVLSLDNALRELLTSGWSFNSDRDYSLTPDGNGRIDIPANAIFVDPTHGEDYTMRYDSGGTAAMRLYHNLNRDFTSFTSDVKCDVIWLFEYEQIPQHARQLVAMKAARKFQSGVVASTILYQFTREMETEAYAGFRRMEKRQKDYNINKYSQGVARRRNPTRY